MESVIMTQELADKLIAAYEEEIKQFENSGWVTPHFRFGICHLVNGIYRKQLDKCIWVLSKSHTMLFPSYWCTTPDTFRIRYGTYEAAKPEILESFQTRINILKQFKTDMEQWQVTSDR